MAHTERQLYVRWIKVPCTKTNIFDLYAEGMGGKEFLPLLLLLFILKFDVDGLEIVSTKDTLYVK